MMTTQRTLSFTAAAAGQQHAAAARAGRDALLVAAAEGVRGLRDSGAVRELQVVVPHMAGSEGVGVKQQRESHHTAGVVR
jgi:hypothetical protein